MEIPLNEVVYWSEITSGADGTTMDATGTPTFVVLEEATDTAIVSASYAQRSGLTGHYRGTFTASAANGFEVGKWYSVTSRAVVDGIDGQKVSMVFRLTSAETVVGNAETNTVSAATTAAAVWNEATSGHTTAGTYGDKFGAHLKGVLKVLLTSGSTTTAVVLNATTGIDGAAPSSTNDFYNGRVLILTSGTLAGQATDITDYVGSTKTLTVTALTGSPASGVTGVVV